MTDCLFCRIVAEEIPASIVYSDEHAIGFRDVNPQAPTHVLVVPRAHYTNAREMAQAEPELAGHVLAAAGAVAEQEGRGGTGYRIVTNTGRGSGQSVFHVHLHVLGGRDLTWPPG